MKALSLWQPWAWAMTEPMPPARKDVENRTWPCPPALIGQRFAIHAAKRWDDSGARFIVQNGLRPPSKHTITLGAIVALATVDRVVTEHAALPVEQQRWFFGPYGYVLRDLAVLREPVPCRGFQMFWTVPPDVLATIDDLLMVDARDFLDRLDHPTPALRSVLTAAVKAKRERAFFLYEKAWAAVPEGTPPGFRGPAALNWLSVAGGGPNDKYAGKPDHAAAGWSPR